MANIPIWKGIGSAIVEALARPTSSRPTSSPSDALIFETSESFLNNILFSML